MKQEEDVHTSSLLPKLRAFNRVGRKPCLYSQDDNGRLSLKQKDLEKMSVMHSNYIMVESEEELFRSYRSLHTYKPCRKTLELKRHILKCRRDHEKILYIASSFLLHARRKEGEKECTISKTWYTPIWFITQSYIYNIGLSEKERVYALLLLVSSQHVVPLLQLT